jgi:Scaffold protein Nfu/NifU N terminal
VNKLADDLWLSNDRAHAVDCVGRPWPYARKMATASPSPTPNSDAMKFTLDTTLPEMLDVTSAQAAVGVPFAEAVFAAGGVAAVFGVNDFVTVRRQPGFEWEPIVAAVIAAAAAHP